MWGRVEETNIFCVYTITIVLPDTLVRVVIVMTIIQKQEG